MENLYDSHAHLCSETLFEQIDLVLERAQTAGVRQITNICTSAKQVADAMALAKRYSWVHNVGGVHPHDAEAEGDSLFPVMCQHALNGDFVAIGETGLDYHYHHSSPEIQKFYLRKHLQLAIKCNLPVVIHCREAFEDLFNILDQEYVIDGRDCGVLHCFTGTMDEAEKVLQRGWYLSFSGIVTFKKSVELRAIAQRVPLNRLLIETDSPYLAPQSQRGKPNEPAFIAETAMVIAALKGMSIEELVTATSENAHRLFRTHIL